MLVRSALVLVAAIVTALPAVAQEWSLGVGAGPFVFGDFVEREISIGMEGGPTTTRSLTLSAATRAGVAVDLERELGERWAVRAKGTFTSAPLSFKSGDDEGIEFDAGEIDVVTLSLPIVFRINRGGAFRFYLLAGPAFGRYDISRRRTANGPELESSENGWGVTVGGGVGWHLSERFAIVGELDDTVTTSPFDAEDFDPDGDERVRIERPHNIHTTVGIRYRF